MNHPTNRSVIYSVTEKGVRKSADLGANWSSILDEPSNYLEVDSVNPSRMWAVGRVRKAFYTLDGGLSWCDLTPFDRHLGAFKLDPNDGDNVYTAAYYGGRDKENYPLLSFLEDHDSDLIPAKEVCR